MLEKLGIFGWDEIEPVIAAAIAARVPLMLTGKSGVGKSVGAKAIARGILGDEVRFRSYPCQTLHPDHMTGPVNPAGYNRGKLEFLATPLSVWDKDVVFLDEPTRADRYVQNALMDLIETREWLGMPTKVKLVISALNPPHIDPDTTYLNVPTGTRFVYAETPSVLDVDAQTRANSPIGELARDDSRLVDMLMAGGDDFAETTPLRGWWEAARVTDSQLEKHFGGAQRCFRETVAMAVSAVAQEIPADCSWSPRQAKHLYKMVLGLARIHIATGGEFSYLDSESFGKVALSTLPEAFGVVAPPGRAMSGVSIHDGFKASVGGILHTAVWANNPAQVITQHIDQAQRWLANPKTRGGRHLALVWAEWADTMIMLLKQTSGEVLGTGEIRKALGKVIMGIGKAPRDVIPESGLEKMLAVQYAMILDAHINPNRPFRLSRLERLRTASDDGNFPKPPTKIKTKTKTRKGKK